MNASYVIATAPEPVIVTAVAGDEDKGADARICIATGCLSLYVTRGATLDLIDALRKAL